MDYVSHPSPAPSLVIAVDMRDSPDILQVKTHPCELCLLSTSDVLSCNTVPSLSASHTPTPRVKEDQNLGLTGRVPKKWPGLTWLTQVGVLILLGQPQAPGMVGKGKEILGLGRSCCGPA